MKKEAILKQIAFINFIILLILLSIAYWSEEKEKIQTNINAKMKLSVSEAPETDLTSQQKEDYIHWVEFNVSKFALSEAYEKDLTSYGTDHPISWIDLLAYAAAYTGGEFTDDGIVLNCMENLEEKLNQGEDLSELTKEMSYFSYYQEAYGAVLGGMVGEYEIEEENGSMTKKYGLKAFHPIAQGFPYADYDDFGASRTYGYKRNHLGHDMLGQTGTPIICVESGYVEALGWNQYGGWRIGIRSFDQKRYYYYAHLRQGFPYQTDLKEGDVVQAGDVIGYMGHTGYSTTEDVNNIDEPHLHFGMELVFDESQKESDHEIWIDCYQIVRFLYRQQSLTKRNDKTKEWHRVYQYKDPAAELYKRQMDDSGR
jgi:murein DD-endopeptidase MepM/ murein hydrolase activator NlpD